MKNIKNFGGIIQYGIPEFRLEQKIIDDTVNKIINLGIKQECNKELGKDFTINELESKYDAIYLSFGKNISAKMNVEGENLKNVLGGNELLEYKDFPDFKNKNVVVIGGGDVAMDVSRTVKRLGAGSVKVLYRRSRDEMPAEENEILDAQKDGVEIIYKTNIVRILGEEKVEKVECIKTKLIDKENETRKVPVNIEDSNFYMDADYVIKAVGSTTNKGLVEMLGLELNKNGTIKINDKYQTSKPKIFAGGDLAGQINTVAWASRDGRNAAKCIMEYLKKN